MTNSIQGEYNAVQEIYTTCWDLFFYIIVIVAIVNFDISFLQTITLNLCEKVRQSVEVNVWDCNWNPANKKLKIKKMPEKMLTWRDLVTKPKNEKPYIK